MHFRDRSCEDDCTDFNKNQFQTAKRQPWTKVHARDVFVAWTLVRGRDCQSLNPSTNRRSGITSQDQIGKKQ